MVSRGRAKRGCGVSLVRRVKNPIRVAGEMLVRGDEDGGGGGGGAQGHVFLSGEEVERLAERWGLDVVDEGYFWTRKRWEEHRRGLELEEGVECKGWKEKIGRTTTVGEEEEDDDEEGWDSHEYLSQGTVGCVALDRHGTLCVATSTGGLTNKLPGRIGDTPTLGAGFWAEEWEEEEVVPRSLKSSLTQSQGARAPLWEFLVPAAVRDALGDCFPALDGYVRVTGSSLEYDSAEKEKEEEKKKKELADTKRATVAVAMSGTGNGDSFLRLAAVRTAAAMARFVPNCELASAVTRIAGPRGELELSAGERWGGGEGEGGIIGIEVRDGEGKVVADFNCGGMFRCWVDEGGVERVMVFREEY